MRLLTFQARRFGWEPFSQTLPDAPEPGPATAVQDAAVAFMHVEARDVQDESRASVFKKTLKHLKWIANKRDLRNVVLHSFTHLGGETADAGAARAFMHELAARLEATGYAVAITPFGWFCSWELSVYGESLAKVYKEL